MMKWGHKSTHLTEVEMDCHVTHIMESALRSSWHMTSAPKTLAIIFILAILTEQGEYVPIT